VLILKEMSTFTPEQKKNSFRDVLNYPAMATISDQEINNVYLNFSRAMGVPLETLNQWAREMWAVLGRPIYQVPLAKPVSPVKSASSPVKSSSPVKAVSPKILDEATIIAKIDPYLNNVAMFDVGSNDSQKTDFLLKVMGGLGPDATEEDLQELLFKAWKPTIPGRTDPKTPIIYRSLVTDVGSKRYQWSFKKVSGIRITDEQYYNRDATGVPLSLQDYRFSSELFMEQYYTGYAPQLPIDKFDDTLGFYYEAIEALENLFDQDYDFYMIYNMGGEILHSVSLEIQMIRDYFKQFFSTYGEDDVSKVLDPKLRATTSITLIFSLKRFYTHAMLPIYQRTANHGRVPKILIDIIELPANPLPTRAQLNVMGISEVLVELDTSERVEFPDSPLLEDIADIYGAIRQLVRPYNAARPEDVVPIILGFATRAAELFRLKADMGRRCINTTDPYDPFIELRTVPQRLHFRFSNGMCWEINSLITYLRGANIAGENTSKGLRGYPSQNLWLNERDLRSLGNHPLAKKNGLGPWLSEIQEASVYKNVTRLTLEIMDKAIQLYVSRGPYYIKTMLEHLETPEQKALFNKYGQDFYNMMNSYTRTEAPVFRELFAITREIIKSKATLMFYEHYQKMTEAEKNALQFYRKDFKESVIDACTVRKGEQQARLCVFIFSRVLQPTYNAIAKRYGMPLSTISLDEPAPRII
jgi:hypothetical protein